MLGGAQDGIYTDRLARSRSDFPRTVIMDDGHIVADGKTKDILDDEKLLMEHGLEQP